eukprot:15163604-Alexandrium_andersonii.AAC.1
MGVRVSVFARVLQAAAGALGASLLACFSKRGLAGGLLRLGAPLGEAPVPLSTQEQELAPWVEDGGS